VYVAWQDNRIFNNPSSCGTYNIRVAKGLPPAAPPAAPPTLQNFPPPANFPLPFTNTITPENQTEPSVALPASGGNLYIAWTDAQVVNHDIYFTKGPVDANITLTTPVRVNDDAGGADHTTPSLALDHINNVYVAWQDTRNGNPDIFFAKSINFGASFDAVPTPTNTFVPTNITEHNIRVNDDTVANGFQNPATHLRPSITVANPEPNASAITPDKIYIAWDDTRWGSQDIITAKSFDGGNTFWTNSAPADHNPATSPNSDSSIAVDTFGRAYLIWTGTSGPASDVFFAIGQ
jgi:hypothetical protein